MGTEDDSGAFDRRLERVGATRMNGVTRDSDTIYQALVPPPALETALWIESERMAFTLERFSNASLNAERDIVLAEMALRSGAGSFIQTFARRGLYPVGHALRPQSRTFGAGLNGSRRNRSGSACSRPFQCSASAIRMNAGAPTR